MDKPWIKWFLEELEFAATTFIKGSIHSQWKTLKHTIHYVQKSPQCNSKGMGLNLWANSIQSRSSTWWMLSQLSSHYISTLSYSCTARLLCPWDSPGKNTGVGCHALLQGIFPTQGSNPGLLHGRQTPYCQSHQGSPLLY